MRTSFWLLVSSILVFTGCATSRGFNRGELRQEMNGKAVVDDAEIAKALTKKAQLPKPFKIGIYFKEPEAARARMPKWRWTEEDKNKLFGLVEDLKATGEVSEIFPVSEATVGGSDLKSLRLAAARHGADALVVVQGLSDVDSYTNDLAWTYIVLVPMLFVPASVNDSLFLTRATMWDVRNEFLYATAEAESLKKDVKPAAFSDDRKITDEAKSESVDKLRGELSKMIASLAQKREVAPGAPKKRQ